MYFQCGHTPDLRKDWTMEDKSKYFVVKQKAVPEVLLKVVEAKKLLETERAITVQILVAIVVTLVIAARASDGFCLNFSTSN